MGALTVLVDVFTELLTTGIQVVLFIAEYIVKLAATAPAGNVSVEYDMLRVIGCSRNTPPAFTL
jgi:hypothetical protein